MEWEFGKILKNINMSTYVCFIWHNFKVEFKIICVRFLKWLYKLKMYQTYFDFMQTYSQNITSFSRILKTKKPGNLMTFFLIQ